jgi:hypothetical protein
MAPSSSTEPVLPMTAVSTIPRRGVAELARTMGQARERIVRRAAARSWPDVSASRLREASS